MKTRLSKSQYTRGLQCVKSLWLYNYRKDLMPEVSPAQQAVYDQGHEVGELARKYFEGGQLIAQDYSDIPGALAATQKAIAEGAEILYEAAFQAGDILVRCDIIKKVGKAWHLIEVKSSTVPKEEHLPDIAIQKHVLEAAGLKVSKAFLMTIDNTFVRRGPIDPQKFFTLTDLSEQIKDAEAEIPGNLKAFFGILAAKAAEPEIEIGSCCSAPYDCDFRSYCWKEIPSYSVFNLPYMKEEVKHELRRKGILKLEDVPAGIKLTGRAKDMVHAAKTREVNINREEIGSFIESLAYPLYHVDFETLNPPIPLYDGLRPYQQMPFQVSIHVQSAPRKGVRHFDYLADASKDPRADIVSFLLEHIGEGTPLAYNASFEKMVIKELAAYSARSRKKLLELAGRFVDLAAPFRARALFMHEFEGSYSIKAVLPALIPDMTYEGMPVANGGDAQNAYKALLSGKLTPAETAKLRGDLTAYCRQDTLAMVKILDHLHGLA